MLTNNALETQVLAGIALDPRIPEPIEIAVSADGDTTTLRGTVESFRQRRAAVEDARDVDGVFAVDDQLKVSLLGSDRREDDEIRGARASHSAQEARSKASSAAPSSVRLDEWTIRRAGQPEGCVRAPA
jgi:BON domain